MAPKDAILECDIDVGEPEAEIKWYKGKKEVKKSPKYEMSYEDEVAALVIHKTEPDDAGVYSIQAQNPLGQVKSEGNLAIHSKYKVNFIKAQNPLGQVKSEGNLAVHSKLKTNVSFY